MNTVVITGTNRGIGLATAQLFLEKGWRVIGTYRETLPPIQSPQFVPVALDLTVPVSIEKAAAEISSTLGPIDALVNNAGVSLDGDDETPDLAKMRATFEVNVFGLIDFAERLVPSVVDGGHILNVGSILGAFSAPVADGSAVAYRMSKAAVHMYTRSLALRLKKRGIVVSVIHPGWVKTDMGNAYATASSGPDREPSEPAEDIFKLITTGKETGLFWYKGKKFGW